MALTRADLDTMDAEAISKAFHSGQLDHLLSGNGTDTARDASTDTRNDSDNEGKLTREQLRGMSPEDISAAWQDGRIAGL